MNKVTEQSFITCSYRPSFKDLVNSKFSNLKHWVRTRLLRLALDIQPVCYTEQKAIEEMKAMGYDLKDPEQGPDLWITENVRDLLRVFSTQGHSGFSAPYCIRMFSDLAEHKALGPLTGSDEEWCKLDYDADTTYQNKRCSHVFKGADGRAYDIQGKVFREPNGCTYTGKDSRVYVTFPYTPVVELVNVPARAD
jgi:hypothetical protein